MNSGARRALEFDRIVDAVRSFALTPTGASALAGIRPDTDARRVQDALQATTETARYLADQPLFPLRAPDDLEELLALLGVIARALEPARLLALATFLESIETAAAAVRRARGNYPRLTSITGRVASFTEEIAGVRRAIAEPNEVVDHASPKLAGIRDRLRRQRGRLRGTLESYLRGKDTGKYLQEQVVTERNGRYVILVKAEHRGSIPGIVHGSSASGATLFVEPLATVEVNNEIVALEAQEAEEVHRILLALTDGFRERASDLQRSTGVATDLDVLQSKARLSQGMDGTAPTIAQDGRLVLIKARHPLLMRTVAARYSSDVQDLPASPVPVDILMEPPHTALLITGPNTGGKTVAIKTAGLLALMAQAGLHIPAEPGSTLPIFWSVFADIGDEQSIAASLSTFSWHITNIASMDRELQRPALVLLDEIGAGTDPTEGGALGIAIVEHFRKRGALVIGTTHYDALKTYASTTPGVMCAAFGFDPDGFTPTYRLMYGTPGRSLALEIAARLGLPQSIIMSAREQVSTRDAQLQHHLARVDEDMRALDREKAAVARERQAIKAAEAEIQERAQTLKEREEQFRRKVTDRIEDRVREARREIDAVVADLKKRTSVLADRVSRQPMTPRLTTGDAGSARLQAQAAIDEVAERLRSGVETPASPAAQPVEQRAPVVGDRVAVGGLGLEGVVVSIHGSGAEIDVRGKRMRAKVKELRLLGRSSPGAAPSEAQVRVNVTLQPRDGLLSEINVIGCNVDEALARTERLLDDTLVTEQKSVRVVHGYGTGQLRRAIVSLLKDHPQVASFHHAPPGQGGDGVTVVELKD
ncbi:MAG TPA: endonuclease MutS2 [Vicinamibacterales bacterium]|nr:endonuclease MutS2 [Vicinamibacterales bacterium]